MDILQQGTEAQRAAVLLITAALSEIEQISKAEDQRYADAETNDKHYWKRRKMTMKDAKPKAAMAAKHLREAWDLLDPPTAHPFTEVKK